MIRDTRTYVAVGTVGALGALMMLIVNVVSPPTRGPFPAWFFTVIALFMVGWFIYTIYMRLSGRPLPRFSWEPTLTDRQLWTFKTVFLAVLAVVAIVIILHR